MRQVRKRTEPKPAFNAPKRASGLAREQSAEEDHGSLAWLAKHECRAPYGMFRVPVDAEEVQGLAPL